MHATQSPAQSRRRFLVTLSSVGTAAFLSTSNASAQDAPPETTTVRLFKALPICRAPQYLADEFLRAEGFTKIEYVLKAPTPIRAARGSDITKARSAV
jgi:NitT/TauT family transport system substrate-binding protein